jgi:hypothetical protein
MKTISFTTLKLFVVLLAMAVVLLFLAATQFSPNFWASVSWNELVSVSWNG